MLLEQPTINIREPIKLEEAKHVLSTGEWDTSPALRLVVQDALRAENYEQTKQWVMGWTTATTLFQSPFSSRYWEGTQTERANIPFFTVATAVESLVPQVISGLFYENPPFIIQERPGTTAQVARAISALIAFQLEDINFQQEVRLGVKNCTLFGTGLWKWGWETFTRERKTYSRKNPPLTVRNPIDGGPDIQVDESDEDIEEIVTEEYIDRPSFEHIVNLRHVLVDPGLMVPDVRKAKYVVHRMYMTWKDLDKLRDRPGYTIPPQEELLQLFFPPKEPVEAATNEVSIRNPLWDARSAPRYEDTTEDPFNQPLEVLERWDDERVITVLQKKLVIGNDENPYGCIPFLSIGWWDVPEAFWGMGLAKTIGSEQRLQQGITNLWLDNAALNLNGVYVRVKGKNIPTQSIRISPGKIVDVEDKDAFKVLDRLPAVPEAGQHLIMSSSRAEQVSGANEASSQGIAGPTGHSNLARSSAGAQLIAAGSGNRMGDFVEKLSNQVIIPFLYHVHEMNRSGLLPVSTLRYILSEELEHEFMKNKGDIFEILNARIKFSILAGAKMQARRNMAQAWPLLIQYLTNQQTENQLAWQGKKINIEEIIRMGLELASWKNYNDIVTDMSKEDQQRWAQMQPGAQVAAKVQGQKELVDQQFQNKLQIVDNENIARAGREVLRQALEKSMEPSVVLGEPGGTGFGSNV